MPKLSVWTIRVSLVHFLVGFTVGAVMLAQKGVSFAPGVFEWLPLHFHALLFGWTLQLIYGVAYFILPKFGRKRGNKPLFVTAVVAVNAGVIIGSFAPLWDAATLVALSAYVASGTAFLLHAWPRVKPFGA